MSQHGSKHYVQQLAYKKIPARKHLKFLGARIVRKLVDLGIFLGISGSLWIFLYPHAIISYRLPKFNYEL